MKTMNFTMALCAFVTLLVGCINTRVPNHHCEADARVYFDYVDEQGKRLVGAPMIMEMIDINTKQSYEPHNYPGDHSLSCGIYDQDGEFMWLNGQVFCPVSYEKASNKIRTYVHSYIKDTVNILKTVGYIADTVDVELKYLSPTRCYIETVSLNGVPQWRCDTCKLQNESFYTRIVRRVVNDKEIVRN